MADDESDKDPSDHLATGSGQLVDGIAVLSSGVRNISVSVWEWFGNHPVVKWVVLLPFGWVVTQVLLEIGGTVYRFYFGRITPIGGDVSVTTTPLPLGLSINILFFLWLVSTSAAAIRIVRLRQQIDQLEQQTQN